MKIDRLLFLAGSLGLLLGLITVLGLAVWRVQQPKPTVTQPKAAGIGWPACAKTGQYACTDNDCFSSSDESRNITKCCSKVKNDPFACAWPARGWCKPPPEQCPDSGGQRCGLYYLNTPECTAPPPPPPATYYKAISPIGGTAVSSLTPTFNWEANTTGINYNNVYVSQNSSCDYDPATGQWLDHVPLTSRQATFPNPLLPNTTYYWNIYGDGPAGIHGAGCQSFKTPVAPECTGDSQCSADKKCENNKCVAVTCTATPPACKKYVVANHACELQNLADGTVCQTTSGAAGTCSAGVCNLPATHFECVNKTCKKVDGAGDNKNGCTSEGGTCCAGASDCSSTQTCDATKTPNSCVPKTCTRDSNCGICSNEASGDCLVCVEGECLPANQIHLSCGTSSTCARKKGAGDNRDGCTTAGASCVPWTCQKDSDCADDKSCSNNQCVTPVCSPEPTVCQEALYKNHACSLRNKPDGTSCGTDKICSVGACVSSEVNSCWGNEGANGRCYDCNGDSEINILDFSCFQKHWLENVQQ